MLTRSLFLLLPLVPAYLAAPLYPWQDGTSATQWSQIRSGKDGLCISIAPPTPSNGTNSTNEFPLYNGYPVITTDCANASLWRISRGSGQIGVANTSLVLDAGENPGNFGKLKVWQSYPGLYQQTWYYTDDARIALQDDDQCLDEGEDGLQTYQCTDNNDNQVWYLDSVNVVTPSSDASKSAAAPVAATIATNTRSSTAATTTRSVASGVTSEELPSPSASRAAATAATIVTSAARSASAAA